VDLSAVTTPLNFMATEFDNMMADGFDDLLALYGETIVYRNKAGVARPITGIVDRAPAEVFNAAGDLVLSPELTIRVHNDSTLGITATELNTGGDKVDVAVKTGADRTTRSLVLLLNSDGGVTEIAVK
jgi:hypothetical protein